MSRPVSREKEMAEVNTGTTEEKFVFGQNMEDRAIKPSPDVKEDNGKTENGAETEKRPLQSPLRPSAFRPSGGILAPSRLGSNPFVQRQTGANNTMQDVSLKSNPFAAKGNSSSSVSTAAETDGPSGRMILKPSALDRQTANIGRNAPSSAAVGASSNYKTTFRLEPAKLQNPLNNQPKADHKENIKEGDPSAPGAVAPGEHVEEDPASSAASPDKGASPESKGAEGGATDVTSGTPPKTAKCKNSAFVFGENMEKRVTNASGNQQASGSPGFVFGERVGDRVSGVGATSPPPENDKEKAASADTDPSSRTLVESAAAHQAKQTRPELHEVDIKTGEENESNVFQINAKLFAFDSTTQSWLERGRGLLRLNDMSATNKQAFQSRLVMRTQGSLRVILNTKVWAGMMVERASQKSVRVTACEGDNDVKVFLIMANPKDADQILSAIEWRVQQQKKIENEHSATTQDRQEPHKLPTTPAQETQSEKRHAETEEAPVPVKKARLEANQRREMPTEESNDSSTLDPETEVSNESFTSTTKSSSSE